LKHLNSIDALRAFAVSIVVFWHFVPDEILFVKTLKEFLPTGNFAVTVFFVLSGYLITNILLNDKERSPRKGVVAAHFLVRRVLRIFPIYFLLLTLLVFLGFPFAPGELPYQFTFTSNIYIFKAGHWTEYMHTWTLAVEEQFYLLWPWLILFIPDKRHTLLFLACILAALVSSRLLICSTYCDEPFYVLTVSNLDAFGLGGLYAKFNRSPGGRDWFRRNIKVLLGVPLAAYLFFRTISFLSIPSDFNFLSRFNNALLALAIIHIFLNIRSGFFKDHVIDNNFVKLTGRISYGIYLYHIPVQFLVKALLYPAARDRGIDPGFTAWFLFDLVLVWTFSYLSYQYIEKPILRFKDRFSISAT